MNADSFAQVEYDVIIVGGGPSGLTAGVYTSRAGLKVLLIESLSVSSQAVITNEIENYPGALESVSGFELIDKFKKQAKKFGTKFSVGDVTKIQPREWQNAMSWQVEAGDRTYSAISVIIASGARPGNLGAPGESALAGRGVSYCAVCDGPFFKGKDIVVVGGGDTAVEEAIFLTKFGKKVMLIHRRDRLRATKILQERAVSNKKISIVWDAVVREISGRDRVEAVKVGNVKTGEEKSIPCDGVFIFVGLKPNTDFVKDTVKVDGKGYIIVDARMRTSVEGIFACGDCRQTYLRQVVTACGDGAFAAFSATQYVEELKGIAYK